MITNIKDYIESQFNKDVTQIQPVGIGGFTLLAIIKRSIGRSSVVPNDTLANGVIVNDHVIANPKTITITGNVSDIHFIESPLEEAFRDLQSKAGEFTQYLPSRTQAQLSQVNGIISDARQAIAVADKILASGAKAASYLGLTDKAKASQGNIQTFVDTMNGYWESGTLIDIETTYDGTLTDMVIESFDTDENPLLKSLDFTMSLRKFNRVSLEFAKVEEVVAKKPAKSMKGKLDKQVDKGVQEGAAPKQSFLSYARGLFN